MKQHRVVVTKHGGPEVLEWVEDDVPVPAFGEVCVQVLAAGVSAYDLMFRRSGALPDTPRVPFTLGEDVVGIVDAIGPGVSDLAVGDLVAGTTLSLGVGGGYAEYVCLPQREWVPVPAEVDPAQAVCVVVNYLTAHAVMHRAGQVTEGQTALIHGAGGGVGSALVELGRLAGLRMFGTASSHNHAVVASLGATPIDYRSEDFVERVRAETGEGVDVVFDPIGGGRQLLRSYRALRKGGRVVWFGVAASKRNGLRVIPTTLAMRGLLALVPDGRRVVSADLGNDKAWYRATLTELLGRLASGQLDPVVAERVPMAEAARAHKILEQGRYAGKVVLVTEAGLEYAGAQPVAGAKAS